MLHMSLHYWKGIEWGKGKCFLPGKEKREERMYNNFYSLKSYLVSYNYRFKVWRK